MALQQSKQPQTFADVCGELVQLHEGKQSGYSKSPIEELPLDVWLAQVQVKATRAKYATGTDKMLDELRDTAVYAILCILKLTGGKL